jgi:two-component system CheB/CheR fusion protein
MPAKSGMAFVVISHQPEKSKNLLPTLLARCTTLPIYEVTHAMQVAPDHLYLATPGTFLALLSNTLQPMAPEALSNASLPIDYFFQTLAEDQREHAIGIVLSGTGTDGTLGLQAIKRHKGMTMVQDQQEAQFPQMPCSARATGVVDHELPVAQMPPALLAFVQGTDEQGLEGCRELAPLTMDLLRQIYVLVRDRTKNNFSSYKPITICRCIERRMRVHQLDSPQQYLQFLHDSPSEIDLLCRDTLIGVTRFFRDPDAFAALAPHVQQLLLRAHAEHRTGRVWVAGCATGEEAYTLAIMLRDGMEDLGIYVPMQIFATDLESQNIDVARAGTYPKSIANDISPAHLERFFDYVDGCYRVKKDLRNMVVFATHNLLADPPFTNLDLLSCRNVLIYLQPTMQRQLLSVFQFALLPHSFLFLGSSESIDGCADQLTPIDTYWRIFQRQEEPTAPCPAVDLPPLMRQAEGHGTVTRLLTKGPGPNFVTAFERHLAQCFAPPSVLVDSRGEVIYIHGHTGQFLQPAHGLQTRQRLLSMVYEGLRLELAAALSQATLTQESVRKQVKLEAPTGLTAVEIMVQPMTNPELPHGLFLVTFTTLPPVAAPPQRRRHPRSQEQVMALEHELQQLQETLKSRTQAAHLFNDELQATNEEWQAANEELQGTKEEMESLNEELRTLNRELQEKVQHLINANDDMQNLLNSTGIATLFLDCQLHIKRFTPQVTRLIKMIPSDVGRPIGDLVSTLAYDRLEADAQETITALIPQERLVATHDREWYVVRMVPYRTSENAIEGVIITFIDVNRFQVMVSGAKQSV